MKKTDQDSRNPKPNTLVFLLSAVLLILCLGSLVWIGLAERTAAGKSALLAVISSEGAEDLVIDLSAVKEPYVLRIDAAGGGYNLLRISKEKVEVLEASCPDKICMRSSAIPGTHLPIVCLPNRLVIRYKNVPADSAGIDAISY
ncbi:MAG: NusG domain II-containing protein [Lachnospiraceae bacterium]|nr:NusG domain II-containing protein [Lachnospiraceae bacterium]